MESSGIFAGLPNEVIQIIGSFCDEESLNRFCQTNKGINSCLRAVLYEHNAKYHASSALRWAAAKGSLPTIEHALPAALKHKTLDSASEWIGEVYDEFSQCSTCSRGSILALFWYGHRWEPMCALHHALSEGHVEIADRLLKEGASKKFDFPALIYALEGGHHEACLRILSMAESDVIDQAFRLAFKTASLETLGWLLSRRSGSDEWLLWRAVASVLRSDWEPHKIRDYFRRILWALDRSADPKALCSRSGSTIDDEELVAAQFPRLSLYGIAQEHPEKLIAKLFSEGSSMPSLAELDAAIGTAYGLLPTNPHLQPQLVGCRNEPPVLHGPRDQPHARCRAAANRVYFEPNFTLVEELDKDLEAARLFRLRHIKKVLLDSLDSAGMKSRARKYAVGIVAAEQSYRDSGYTTDTVAPPVRSQCRTHAMFGCRFRPDRGAFSCRRCRDNVQEAMALLCCRQPLCMRCARHVERCAAKGEHCTF